MGEARVERACSGSVDWLRTEKRRPCRDADRAAWEGVSCMRSRIAVRSVYERMRVWLGAFMLGDVVPRPNAIICLTSEVCFADRQSCV